MEIKLNMENGHLEWDCDYTQRKYPRQAGFTWRAGIKRWVLNIKNNYNYVLPDSFFENGMDSVSIKMDAQVKTYLCDLYNQHLEIQKIKKETLDAFRDDFLMPHQVKALRLSQLAPRLALYHDTGTGKTITSLAIIKDKLTHLSSKSERFLIIAPKAIIKPAWLKDCKDHYPDIKLMPLSKNIKKENLEDLYKQWLPKENVPRSVTEINKVLMGVARGYIINPESFIRLTHEDLLAMNINMLVVDEATTIKNIKAQVTKKVIILADKVKYVYILSGLPAPNGEQDYFSQMRTLTPSIFGTNYYRFLETYFNKNFGGFGYTIKAGAPQKIMDKVAQLSFSVTKAECLDLPDKTYIVRNVTLNPTEHKAYKFMKQNYIVAFEQGIVSAPNKVTSLMKLRQITSGFVMDTENNTTKQLGTSKLDELMSLVDELGSNQMVIWIQYKEEVSQITRKLKDKGISYVTAYGETKDVQQSIEEFDTGKAQFIIAHPATLKFGVTLVNCTYMCFYSMSYNLEEYYQAHDRIYRKGQTRPCTFINLVAEETIDQTIYDIIQDKLQKYYADGGSFGLDDNLLIEKELGG